MSWMHQRTVPMVPRTFDASVILSSEGIVDESEVYHAYDSAMNSDNDIADCSGHTIYPR